MSKRIENAAGTAETEVFMKLDIREKKVLVCIWMPGLPQYGHKAEVAGFIDRGSGSETLAAGACPENGNGRLQRLAFLLLSSSPHGDGRIFQGKEIYEGCGVKHKS